jgi:hypothetical protein
MKTDLKSTVTAEMLGLPHLSRELSQIVEPGQEIPNRDRIYNLVCGGDLQMIQFIRGRWYCSKDDLPALAQELCLRLREPATKETSRPRANRSTASAA